MYSFFGLFLVIWSEHVIILKKKAAFCTPFNLLSPVYSFFLLYTFPSSIAYILLSPDKGHTATPMLNLRNSQPRKCNYGKAEHTMEQLVYVKCLFVSPSAQTTILHPSPPHHTSTSTTATTNHHLYHHRHHHGTGRPYPCLA